MKKILSILLFISQFAEAQPGFTTGGSLPTTVINPQVPSYFINFVGTSYIAWPRQGSSYALISNIDVATVINSARAILCTGGTLGSGGGKILVAEGSYTLSTDITIAGWEGGNAPYSQIIISGMGFGTHFTQNTSGKNGFTITGNPSVVIENMRISCGPTALSCIKTDTTLTEKTAMSRSMLVNLLLENLNSGVPALFLRNIFSTSVTSVKVFANNTVAAFLLENASSSVSYGNSTFVMIEVANDNTTAGAASILVRSSVSGRRMDHTTFNNPYVYGKAPYGIKLDDSEDFTLLGPDIEPGPGATTFVPIAMGIAPATGTWAKQNNVYGGTLLSTAGSPTIVLGAKAFGNLFSNIKCLPGDNTTALFTDSSNSNMPNKFDIAIEFPGISNPFIQRPTLTGYSWSKWDGTSNLFK